MPGYLLVLSLLVALAASAPGEDKYTDKYDHVDIDNILKNERLRMQYFNCFLDTAPCLTPDAKFFKEKFPEAIVTKCRKCTNKQKEGFEKIVVYYTEKNPEEWNKVLSKAINDYSKKSKTG